MKWLAGAWAFISVVLYSCTMPHDFGEAHHLVTICHVYADEEGFRAEETVMMNSDNKRHRDHPWDTPGPCGDSSD
jgi:hypothetical protein